MSAYVRVLLEQGLRLVYFDDPVRIADAAAEKAANYLEPRGFFHGMAEGHLKTSNHGSR
jgi:hypothetical protein